MVSPAVCLSLAKSAADFGPVDESRDVVVAEGVDDSSIESTVEESNVGSGVEIIGGGGLVRVDCSAGTEAGVVEP